jgi:TFIIF-interacting CTD phosphatase-like protein
MFRKTTVSHKLHTYGIRNRLFEVATIPYTNFKYTPEQLAAWQSLPYNKCLFSEPGEDKTDPSKAYSGEDVLFPPKLPIHKGKKTLVVNVTDVLVSLGQFKYEGENPGSFTCREGKTHYIYERPGARDFIHQMNELFEVVAFTTWIIESATSVMKHFDPDNKFGDHFHQKRILNFEYDDNFQDIDLFKTGRPLAQIMLLDNLVFTFEDQPRNNIHIPEFECNDKDTCLIDIIPMMKEIAKADRVYDVLDPFNAQFVLQEDLDKCCK